MEAMLLAVEHDFNPRSPHGERRLARKQFQIDCGAFQSTLPARGATRPRYYGAEQRNHFNPRSPHGERLIGRIRQLKNLMISIHAPRTGSDGGS